MANRFYIPPGRNPGIDYANLALGLMNTYQRGKIAKGYQDVARERTAVAERGVAESERVGKIRFGEEGKPGLEQRRVETMEDKTPWHLRPVNPQKWAAGKAKLSNLGMDKALQPIMQIADMALNNKMTRADLYATYKSSPLAFKEAEQNLQKELQGAMKKGDEVKTAQITEMIGWMAEPQSFLDASFPGVRQELEGKPSTPEKLYETEEGWQPRSEAIGKLKPEGEGRALKTYITPEGKIDYLPNNEKPPKGWTPYSDSGAMEDRMNKRQELITIRQDKAHLRREISRVQQLPDLNIYRQQRDQLPLLEDELLDLGQREAELLKGGGQDIGRLDVKSIEKSLPPGLSEEDIQFNMKKYGKTRQQVIERFLQTQQ